jgi:hypothetical protein|tara:strand:+ start:177 stop:341 length:165 start_codon:yes stop_codon:yes gene_type:complete
MKKEQIRDVLGEPVAITISSMLEYWSYRPNASQGSQNPSIRFTNGEVAGIYEPD